jgi:peptide/nickel transport system substrate-binding protein
VAFVPNLAESWSNPDPNTWRVKLKQGVKFHNGNAFNADDVVFSFERVNTDAQSRQKEKTANLSAWTKLDDYTVDLKTKSPDAALMATLYNLSILDKETHQQLGTEAADKAAVGTGPYKFKEWVTGQRLVLERNPDYHGQPKPSVDEVIYRVIPEAEARTTALLNGEVDVIAIVPPQHVQRINSSGVAEIRGTLLNRPEFIAFNHSMQPWDNFKLREAVAHAIDREAIASGILGGEGRALYTPLGPGMIGYDEALESKWKAKYRYDPEKAKQLVIEAGFPNGLDAELGCPINRFVKDKEICEAYGQMLRQVGIRVKFYTPEYNTLLANAGDGKLAFYMFGRGSVVDPSDYLHQYFMPGTSKRIQFNDPKTTELLRKEKATFDPKERLTVLRDVQDAIMEKLGVVPTYQSVNNWGVGKRVTWKARADEYMPANEMSVR